MLVVMHVDDATRVKLLEGPDYINANYVNVRECVCGCVGDSIINDNDIQVEEVMIFRVCIVVSVIKQLPCNTPFLVPVS